MSDNVYSVKAGYVSGIRQTQHDTGREGTSQNDPELGVENE